MVMWFNFTLHGQTMAVEADSVEFVSAGKKIIIIDGSMYQVKYEPVKLNEIPEKSS